MTPCKNGPTNDRIGGKGGLNNFEAALVYTYTTAGQQKTAYFPGGTNRVFDSQDKVLYIFRTLARADGQGIVRGVYKRYTKTNADRPADMPLP